MAWTWEKRQTNEMQIVSKWQWWFFYGTILLWWSLYSIHLYILITVCVDCKQRCQLDLLLFPFFSQSSFLFLFSFLWQKIDWSDLLWKRSSNSYTEQWSFSLLSLSSFTFNCFYTRSTVTSVIVLIISIVISMVASIDFSIDIDSSQHTLAHKQCFESVYDSIYQNMCKIVHVRLWMYCMIHVMAKLVMIAWLANSITGMKLTNRKSIYRSIDLNGRVRADKWAHEKHHTIYIAEKITLGYANNGQNAYANRFAKC